MKYLFLAYGDEQQWQMRPVNEREAFNEVCQANDEALRESGYLLTAKALQGSHTATTLRIENGELCLSDGPFAQTEEQLMGLFFINARDLNEAIQVAAKMPEARRGPIEVRALVEFEGH